MNNDELKEQIYDITGCLSKDIEQVLALCEPYFRQLERDECVERVKDIDCPLRAGGVMVIMKHDAIKAIQTKGE